MLLKCLFSILQIQLGKLLRNSLHYHYTLPGLTLLLFLTTGDNRFVIVQVDECCCVSSLQAQVVICPQCNLQDQCHIAGTCNTSSGICSNPTAPNGQPCDDGNTCTQIDTCQSGSCVGSDPVVCVASDQCHTPGTCDAAGICSNPTAPNGQTCDDGNACTQIDTCQSGSCVGSDPVVCVASDQCHVVGTCDVATGICSNPNAPNGTSCNDGNSCTISDGCELGTCVGSNVCCYDTKSNRCGCCVKDCGNDYTYVLGIFGLTGTQSDINAKEGGGHFCGPLLCCMPDNQTTATISNGVCSVLTK